MSYPVRAKGLVNMVRIIEKQKLTLHLVLSSGLSMTSKDLVPGETLKCLRNATLRVCLLLGSGGHQTLFSLAVHESRFARSHYIKMTDRPVGWGCRIYRRHLCRRVRHPQRMSGYDTKQSDGEVSVMLDVWGIRSTPSLPSLPGLL